MEIIKIVFKFIISFVFGFGFWFLIFWFITSQPNLFEWHVATKIVYLLFSFASVNGIAKALIEE